MHPELEKTFSQLWEEDRKRRNLLFTPPAPPKETADWVFERLEGEFERLKALAKQGQVVRLQCSTGFGIMIVKELSAENGNLLRMILIPIVCRQDRGCPNFSPAPVLLRSLSACPDAAALREVKRNFRCRLTQVYNPHLLDGCKFCNTLRGNELRKSGVGKLYTCRLKTNPSSGAIRLISDWVIATYEMASAVCRGAGVGATGAGRVWGCGCKGLLVSSLWL